MTEFLYSARRDLRLQLRLEAELSAARGGYLGYTEDVGAGGCRLLGPLRLATGSRLSLHLIGNETTAALSVGARVVWRWDDPAWRHGLAFAADASSRAGSWFDEVVRTHPGLLDVDRVPDRIGLGCRIYVARAPREVLSVEEAAVLRLARDRPSVADLHLALGHCWSGAQRALYSLLHRGLVALEPGGS